MFSVYTTDQRCRTGAACLTNIDWALLIIRSLHVLVSGWSVPVWAAWPAPGPLQPHPGRAHRDCHLRTFSLALMSASHWSDSNENSRILKWQPECAAACGGYTREDCVTLDPSSGLWRSGVQHGLWVSDILLVISFNTELWLADLCYPGLQGELGTCDPPLLPRVLGQRPGEASVDLYCVSDCFKLFNWKHAPTIARDIKS